MEPWVQVALQIPQAAQQHRCEQCTLALHMSWYGPQPSSPPTHVPLAHRPPAGTEQGGRLRGMEERWGTQGSKMLLQSLPCLLVRNDLLGQTLPQVPQFIGSTVKSRQRFVHN